ncbi:uncharacterized protein LY89DRAFT_654925 [Mollisia scopiformis]|uniref:Uncharacterized protein n=1 Tax=Mollisia scopiformis TaxID=149040 RepID=A0A194WUA2_MOLSC|nr:uncharacterized protein LY89DRAFT_654925 [Mollisia scopiformis]KUJ11187.1 hypothetical protein LY89DRAFT_654925 [Mollisia scopiformis]
MPTKTLPTLLPYRDAHSTEVKYTAPPSSSSSTHLYNTPLPYDSDNEPLIPNPYTTLPAPLSDYDLAHFTATGRPAPAFKSPSGLASLGGHMFTAPQLLPQRYTDDSIIPAIIVDVIPSPSLHPQKKARKNGLLGKVLRPREGDGKGKGVMKVAFMPRREYLKYFARGVQGEYIGTEPYRRWSEEELEREFGRFKPACLEKKKGGRKI